MAVFQRVGVTSGGSLDHAATHVSLQVGSGGGVKLYDHGFGLSSGWSVSGSVAARVGSDTDHAGAARIAITLDGQSGGVLREAVTGAFDAWQGGERSAQTLYLGATPHGGNAATTLAAEVGGQQMVFAALQNGIGLTAYRHTNGTLSSATSYGSDDSLYSAGISDMAVVQTGGGSYLFTGSAVQHGITSYAIGSGGGLNTLGTIGAETSLPVTTLTALDAAQVGTAHFLIAAASGTSSLTVLAVSDQGQLTVTDHITDTLGTRFQGVSQLEVVQMGAHSFVLASGMDDGLSLFRLTQNGRLVHAHTIEDTVLTGLQGISALAGVAGANGFDVVLTSANEVGMTQFRVDFNPNGIVATGSGDAFQGTGGADMLRLGAGGGRVLAGAGNDILMDGSGEDRMHGGAGADTFVLIRDGQRDRIDDFDITQDRLDLSAWKTLYSASQLQVQTTGNGVRLSFGNEELDLRTVNGAPLDAAQIAQATGVFLSHVDVVLGPRLVTTVPPAAQMPLPVIPPSLQPHVGAQQGPGSSFVPNTDAAATPQPSPETPDSSGGGGLSLEGGGGNDVLTGSANDDQISGGGGNDTIEGGAGNDMLAGSDGNDVLRGGGGNDSIGGGQGNDTIEGGDGNDEIGGGQGNDRIYGNAGDDLLSGGPGNDLLEGGEGDDMLAGSFGNDTVNGGGGNDNLGGGTGKDIIAGGAGNDKMGGGEGDDRLDGGPGNDFIAGGGRSDTLLGGGGSDTLNAGADNDTMSGGAGQDTFVFNDLNKGEYDIITDFDVGVDTLRLHGVAGSSQNARFNALDITAAAGGVEIRYDGHTILLQGVGPGDVDRSDFLFL